MMYVLVTLVAVLALISGSLLIAGNGRSSWFAFYAKARKLRFTFTEARSLRGVARMAGLSDPMNLFLSAKDLDRVIAFYQRAKHENREEERAASKVVERLFTIRKDIELNQPRFMLGIKTSRHIIANQRMRVLLQGVGVFNATLIDNHQRYMVISYPIGVRLPEGYLWRGKKVSIYFWRQEDAGYVFDTYVIDDLKIRNVPVLHLAHSDSLFRTQKRKSVRARSRISAYLYIMHGIEGAYEKPERIPGMRCVIQDLSEDGAAILIGGKAKSGLLLKIQFFLGDKEIVMSGTARGVDYQPGDNKSVIHIEAVKPSVHIRNAIRNYVYNLKTDPNGGANPFL